MLPKTDSVQEAIKQDKAALFTDTARATYAQALIDLLDEGKPIAVVECDLLKSSGTAVAAYPRTLFIKDSSTVENWARNAPATVLKK